MTRERWETIVQHIRNTFTVIDEYEEDLEPGIAEVIEFESPHGTIQASFITRPKVLGKKTAYSHRAGGDVRVDYEFSETETISRMELAKLSADGNSWEPIDGTEMF